MTITFLTFVAMEKKSRNFREYPVWQESVDFSTQRYKLTSDLQVDEVVARYTAFCEASGREMRGIHAAGTVVEAVRLALELAAASKAGTPDARPLIYIGGSTYVVSEAVALFNV